MKMRSGFVSNSSSASFVLNTKMSVVALKEFMIKKVGMNKDWILKRLGGDLDATKDFLTFIHKEENEFLRKHDRSSTEKRIKDLEKHIRKVERAKTEKEALEVYLRYCRVQPQQNWYGFACISGYTNMYNDDESMGEPCWSIAQKLQEVYGNDGCWIDWSSDGC
jgi:hypothetical protein